MPIASVVKKKKSYALAGVDVDLAIDSSGAFNHSLSKPTVHKCLEKSVASAVYLRRTFLECAAGPRRERRGLGRN
jgi:hypothetical protein